MKKGLIGALVGLIVGLVVGMAVAGPLGGAVGILVGPFAGFFIMTPLAVGSANEAAKGSFIVKCPETHRSALVTLDPKEAGRAELLNRPQRIATCTRFAGQAQCEEGCLSQLQV